METINTTFINHYHPETWNLHTSIHQCKAEACTWAESKDRRSAEESLARGNFFEAVDQQGAYESLEQALDSYEQNVTDTAMELELSVSGATSHYDHLRQEHPIESLWQPQEIDHQVSKLTNDRLASLAKAIDREQTERREAQEAEDYDRDTEFGFHPNLQS